MPSNLLASCVSPEDFIREFESHRKPLSAQFPVNHPQSAQSTDWELLADVKDEADLIKVWRQPDRNSSLYNYKMLSRRENTDVKLMRQMILDYSYRTHWDPFTTDLEVLEEFEVKEETIQHVILWWKTRVPFPVFAPRDYVFERKAFHVGDYFIIVDRSLEHSKAPPDDAFIRVDSYNRFIVYKAGSQNNTLEEYSRSMNPVDWKGSIPTFIMNWMTRQGLKRFFKNSRKTIESYPKYLTERNHQQHDHNTDSKT